MRKKDIADQDYLESRLFGGLNLKPLRCENLGKR